MRLGESVRMRRWAIVLLLMAALSVASPAMAAPKLAVASRATVAALQIGLRAQGLYPGPIDGVAGPMTNAAVAHLRRAHGLRASRTIDVRLRRALGPLGAPLLGQRELWTGLIGWDVASLEFRLVKYGLSPGAVDGRFDSATQIALERFQLLHGLHPDGIAGRQTYRALAHRVRRTTATVRQQHVVQPGESFFSIAQRYRVSPWLLARENGLRLMGVIVPGQRLWIPRGGSPLSPAVSEVQAGGGTVRESLDHWAAVYGVDPQLARALAWMESGFQEDVVSNVGAVGVMQLLPETWDWVDVMLLGTHTPRTADGNVQAGVRYLRWQLDQFRGDRKLALAGWYQGARAVREIGIYNETKQFVSIVLQLYGKV